MGADLGIFEKNTQGENVKMSRNEASIFNNAFGSNEILLNSSLEHTSFLLLNSSDLTKSLTLSQPINYFSPLNRFDTFSLPTQQPAVVEPIKQFKTFNHQVQKKVNTAILLSFVIFGINRWGCTDNPREPNRAGDRLFPSSYVTNLSNLHKNRSLIAIT